MRLAVGVATAAGVCSVRGVTVGARYAGLADESPAPGVVRTPYPCCAPAAAVLLPPCTYVGPEFMKSGLMSPAAARPCCTIRSRALFGDEEYSVEDGDMFEKTKTKTNKKTKTSCEAEKTNHASWRELLEGKTSSKLA